ncbi:larval serum protein 1 beta chain-like [Musca autumnalis]|uniref:larval serum protein 1 beta chain-like n=1 Tax=Musca autumnalis TaxID=221902 RepID=UPI003CF4A1BF
MEISIAFLALVAIVSAASLSQVKIANKDFLEKQKFLFEIVYRVEDPLMFEEWIKLGEKFIIDKSYYSYYDEHMEKFWEAYKMGALLPRGEFFGALVKSHHKQAWGLFNFFYFAKDWETFMHNVCWARMHVNEGMFVYALTLAVIHRDDFEGLMLPTIYEIFPQYFFDSKFIYEAEKFDYDMWSKYIMYEKEFQDFYYKNNKNYNNGGYMYMKDWKMWQWWKLMGIDKSHWYTEENFMLRENIYEFNQDPKWNSMLKDVKMWWMPVDYTRDIDFYNKESALSYFTEDLGWNSFWYYKNMDYAFFLDGKTFGLNKDRRGEFWLYTIQKLMSRYYMERLSHGYGEIPEVFWMSEIEHGYVPHLISYNGVGFSYRPNYYDMTTFANVEMLNRIRGAFHRIEEIIDTGYYKMYDGTMVDLRKPEAIEFIGSMLQSNMDVFDKYFFNYYYMYAFMSISDVDYHHMEVSPNIFLNFETMLRDPLSYTFHKKISDVFFRFKDHLKPYTKDELMFPGVEIKDVHVSELVTYFDLVDFDVTNLLNDKMVFVDGKFVWDKTLLARQMRLNHKPFNFDLTVLSDKQQKAAIRIFIAPKYDEFGRYIPMSENRENFFTLDKFVVDLEPGKNMISRNSNEFYWTGKDRTTYTELYHYVMMAYEGKYDMPLDISEPHCMFPDRLILPRGWEKGMPMRMFFMVSPYEETSHQYSSFDVTYSCGIGTGSRFTDSKPFFYPFDRKIDEFDFYVPNMYFKDVEIYHFDSTKMYMKDEYKNYGKFDYTFFDNYYTKYFK